jgi:hypothetical protein
MPVSKEEHGDNISVIVLTTDRQIRLVMARIGLFSPRHDRRQISQDFLRVSGDRFL